MSVLLRPVLPLSVFPEATRVFLRSPRTIQHTFALGNSEMAVIRAPDLEWFRRQTRTGTATHASGALGGLYGVWADGNLDGWVGREGPMVQDALGSGRVVRLQGVPHTFCLSESVGATRRPS